ncbi:MAG: thioredoxin family protein [Marinosulfonomonas sp.]|nr:thioredoxin family protein [Marinosulfonomonas sp.]
MAEIPPVCDFGWKAPDFSLPATDGKTYTFSDIAGKNGTLIMFICNHCPYVLSVLDRIVRDGKALQDLGIGVAAICANDAAQYPADSFEKMVELAAREGFSFPYLHDETQDIAKAYDAACTPDFFGFNTAGELQYRGRLDASQRQAADKNARRDLFEAMKQVAQTGAGPDDQTASMGCSIKWKAA